MYLETDCNSLNLNKIVMVYIVIVGTCHRTIHVIDIDADGLVVQKLRKGYPIKREKTHQL